MLWDPLRYLWVVETPEERVRQELIQKMIGPLGYPKSLLAVEKELPSLPGRRIDLLCFIPADESLRPLLLVECKAQKMGASALAQGWGYNFSLGAPFLCLTNGVSTETYWHEEGKIASVPFLPLFAELVKKVREG